MNIFDAPAALARIKKWFFGSTFAAADSTDGRRPIVIYRGYIVGSAGGSVKRVELVAGDGGRGCGRVLHDGGVDKEETGELKPLFLLQCVDRMPSRGLVRLKLLAEPCARWRDEET